MRFTGAIPGWTCGSNQHIICVFFFLIFKLSPALAQCFSDHIMYLTLTPTRTAWLPPTCQNYQKYGSMRLAWGWDEGSLKTAVHFAGRNDGQHPTSRHWSRICREAEQSEGITGDTGHPEFCAWGDRVREEGETQWQFESDARAGATPSYITTCSNVSLEKTEVRLGVVDMSR